MKKSIENREEFLFLAGSWFAMAFSVPVLVFWREAERSVVDFLFFIFPPIALAFLCGEAFGSDILKPGLVQNSRQALVKGVKTFLLTYAYFTPVFALSYAFYTSMFFRDEHEWLTVQFIENIFIGLFKVAVIGLAAFGWILAILGALAGWTLYKFRTLQERP
jgi:hypothetical protein